MANDKKYYAVKVQAMVPAEIVYRVLAEDEDEALKMSEQNPQIVQKRITNTSRIKKLKATVYEYGSVMILKQKNY